MWDDHHSLYPYQERAVKIMTESNMLLAYDMGTGKTPTTIAAIERMRERKQLSGWGIVLTPASLKFQWQREIVKFTTHEAGIMVIDGNPPMRHMQYETLKLAISTGNTHGYVIMSYDTYVRDHPFSDAAPLMNAFMVLDEATAIKSFKAKRTKMLKKHRNNYAVRFALTGTPIENGALEELFSIMEWVVPSAVGPWWKFERDHVTRNSMGWITGYRDVRGFHRKIKPHVLRMTVDDPEVASVMPEVVYYPPLIVTPDTGTMTVYLDIRDEMLKRLESLSKNRTPDDAPDGRLMSQIQTARMLLNHPLAVLYSAARYEASDSVDGSAFAARIVKRGWMNDVVKTPKLDRLIEYLKDFFDGGHPDSKVVVFCSFVDAAEKIHEALPWQSVLFTGSLTPKQRDTIKQTFVSDPDVKVFVSTDAGGYGLDLPVANMVINYDLPWQSGAWKQRNARIRRAASTWKHVFVQDIVMSGTIEERIADVVAHKNAVADGAVDGKGLTDDGELADTLGSLSDFLRDLY